MSYIIQSTSPFVSIKLTEKGREQLSLGRLNFSYFAIGDSEINYDREAIVDAVHGPNDLTLSATSKVFRPFDRQPNIKSFVSQNSSLSPFQVINSSNLSVVKAVVNNEATERGFFSVSGDVFTTLTGDTYSPYYQLMSSYNFSGGTTLNGFSSTSNINIGDIMLVKLVNDDISVNTSSSYSLGAAASYVILTPAALTVTSGQIVDGNVGQLGAPVGAIVYTSGANYPAPASSPAVADAAALYATLSVLTGTSILSPTAIELGNYGNGAGVFTPGIYTTAGAIGLTASGTITLSGAGDYVFVSTGGAMTTGAASNMILANGATANRIFWITSGALSIGAGSSIFKGNSISPAGQVTGGITFIEGRLLSTVAAISTAGGLITLNIPSSSGSSIFGTTGFTNSSPIPNLWFKIQAKTSTSVTVDRSLPNYSTNVTSNSLIIIYRSGEVYNSIATGDTTAYWDSGTLSFDSATNITCHDVPVWNMNNVWSENLAGMTGLTDSLPIYEDYTKFGSYPYLGTKNPYLEYLSESTASTLTSNCNGPGFSYLDDVSKSVSIIHYTNNTISNLYGEFLYIDTTNDKTVKIYLPDLMYHRRGFTSGSGTSMGMTFIASGETKFVGTSDIEYLDLIEDPTLISSATTAQAIGRVYPQLKIVVIHDDEIVAAISYKSNRNWTLPELAANLASPSGGTSTGILGINSTIYLSYSLENENITGLTTSLSTQKYIKVTNSSSSNKDVAFRISETDLLPYMRKIENGGYDGLGFYANRFKLIYQIVQDQNTRPDPGAWKTYDFTSTAITGVVNETIDPKLLENQNPTITGFVLDVLKDAVSTTFDITQSLNMSTNNSPSTLQFGDERFFYGNLTTFIGATIFKTIIDVKVNASEFNKTTNPTRSQDISTSPPNIKVSEVGVYDNNNNLVIIGKLSTPVALVSGSIVSLELSMDF